MKEHADLEGFSVLFTLSVMINHTRTQGCIILQSIQIDLSLYTRSTYLSLYVYASCVSLSWHVILLQERGTAYAQCW